MIKPVILFIMVIFISGCVEPQRPGTINNRQGIPEYSPVVDIAKNDLAIRLNTSPEQITFISQEQVDWPDTSLGFPVEGMMYAQVITPGFRIILKAGEKSFEYHSDYQRIAGPREIQ